MDFKMPSFLMESATDIFHIEREGQQIASAHGFFCGKESPSSIQLVENVDVRVGDWMIHQLTGNRYFVTDARPISMEGQIVDWMVKYQSEYDWKKEQAAQNVASINIGSVSGTAIIGNQHSASINVGYTADDITKLLANKPASDMPLLVELVSLLKEMEAKDEPIKKGALSKFSDLLQKHSDLLVALGGWAVKLLVGD